MAQSGYMDNVMVKISEKYKPPPRINLPTSYAQRLTLNQQIQDTIPQYEFVLEKAVIEKMKEWRSARAVMFEQLNERVRSAEPPKISSIKEAVNTTNSLSYSNILTPIPLKETRVNISSSNDFKSPDKSPFNISDFEADNYSPFDNLELKSINDMEELAQVLKAGDLEPPTTNFNTSTSPTLNYDLLGAAKYNYTIPTTTSYLPATYYTNGYYYPPETITNHQSASYSFNSSNQIDNKYISSPSHGMRSFKSIPDIMKSLEKEIENTHLDNKSPPLGIHKIKSKSEESVDEFQALPKSVQDMSKTISSMGFPLSRVARACKVIGNDQKKVRIILHFLPKQNLN